MDEHHDYIMNIVKNSCDVRRSEAICYLIGFGIGIGCCIVYRFLTNFLNSLTNTNSFADIQPDIDTLTSKNNSYTKEPHSRNRKCTNEDDVRNNTVIDEMTWSSEFSSSLSTLNLFHDSYHSNSLTGDSGVDCPEIPTRNHQLYDENTDLLLKKYDTETKFHRDTQIATESRMMSYISTEKGLERALEQTSRFYTDLEHIATDLGSLTKRYSSPHRSIDALDWDWLDDIPSPTSQSPKHNQRKQQNSSRTTNKSKIRRRLNLTNINQTEYNESDNENRSFEYSTSPLRRKHSSVYFNSSDNTSEDEQMGDETLQIN